MTKILLYYSIIVFKNNIIFVLELYFNIYFRMGY